MLTDQMDGCPGLAQQYAMHAYLLSGLSSLVVPYLDAKFELCPSTAIPYITRFYLAKPVYSRSQDIIVSNSSWRDE